MDDVSDRTTQLQVFLDRMNEGNPAARLELMGHAYRRLERLARSKLHGFPHLRRWEETGSILHNALLSLESISGRGPPKECPRVLRACLQAHTLDSPRPGTGPARREYERWGAERRRYRAR